jgi:iron complex transport system ATP-binding protein
MIMEVKNISFSYNNKNNNNINNKNSINNRDNIFENISFSVEKGDVFCILGHNGTGKTTLLKCLNGLYDIGDGDILIDEKSIHALSFNEISKTIGYIPQKHVSTFPFSVMDVVLMGRAPYISLTNSPKEHDIEIAENALKTLNVYQLKDREYTNLSGGEQQLVFLARVL